jgi:hypothetical protein
MNMVRPLASDLGGAKTLRLMALLFGQGPKLLL